MRIQRRKGWYPCSEVVSLSLSSCSSRPRRGRSPPNPNPSTRRSMAIFAGGSSGRFGEAGRRARRACRTIRPSTTSAARPAECGRPTTPASTWSPIFDRAGSASVGALAIAPSDAKVIYVGTGQIQARYDIASGDGVYRSGDGGATWTHVGLEADAGDRPDRRRSARCQRRGRRRARAHVRAEPRARDLPHGGRRENLGARALRGREDGRRRPRGGSGESLDSLRVALAGAQLPLALLLQADGRVGQRASTSPATRADLDEALGRRLAVGRRRANRSRGRAGRSRVRPRRRRGRRAARAFGGGPVSLRRWRRELEPRQRRRRVSPRAT